MNSFLVGVLAGILVVCVMGVSFSLLNEYGIRFVLRPVCWLTDHRWDWTGGLGWTTRTAEERSMHTDHWSCTRCHASFVAVYASEEEVDYNRILLNEERWNAFTARLDSPPTPNEKLKALLTKPTPWDPPVRIPDPWDGHPLD